MKEVVDIIADKMADLVKNSSVIRAMFEEGKKMASLYGEENIYDFSLGNPNIEPPNEVEKAMYDVINNEDKLVLHGYMSNSGYEDVRRTVADSINKRFQTDFTAQNILMTTGAAGGLNVILKTLINPGDEIIVFAPFFGEYKNYVSNVDGNLVVISAEPPDFMPKLREFSEKITAKTKAVIINTPNNPTGVIYTEECIKNITEILYKKQKEYETSIYLISDEPYRELVYDNAYVPYVTKYYDNTIVGYSFSKSLSLPGERIGYLVLPDTLCDFKNIIEAASVANRILGFVNAPSFMQKVIMRCMDVKTDIDAYNRNRELLYGELTKYGYECRKPEGAFYLFVKAPGEDDILFCEKAKEHHILIVPGSAFACPGYVRIAYCVDYNMICRSLNSFKVLIEEYEKDSGNN